jgi:hypothetical protein
MVEEASRRKNSSRVASKGKETAVKRLIATTAAAGGLLVAPSAPATIHPIMVGWWCGNTSGDPPGQTPGENHSEQSTFRALQATGVLTLTEGGPVLDLTNPASKFSTFDVSTETGTPSNPGALNCAGAP